MSLLQHVLCTDPEEISDETLDAADVMDMDVFEELQQYSDQCSTATIPNQGRIGGLNAAVIPDQEDMEFDIDEEISPQTNQTEAETDDPNTMSTMVIDRFPSGSPGIPIPGMPHRASAHELAQDRSMESIWAPFWSQKDWKIAHWVKISSSSSSDVDNLMAISGVCTFFSSVYCL